MATTRIAVEWKRDVREWTRRIWASRAARRVWEPRITAVTNAWLEAEWRSVIDGVRPSALLSVTPDDLPRSTRRAAAHGLLLAPLGRSGQAASYSAGAVPVEDGGAWTYRAALTRPEHTGGWYGAWERSDDDAIGELLGFPECCRTFFTRVWGKKIDTTWWMADPDGWEEPVELDADPRNNILLRWLGVRAVPHLPCSFDCAHTRELADRMLALVRQPERGWLDTMLAWPVEWSALHGIAEVKTPVVKISAKTDWSPTKRVVRLRGSAYPEEGARGNVFPYLDAQAKRRKLVQIKGTPDPRDNGFSSHAAQEAAHRPIVRLAGRHVNGSARILDLGCGNGRLLERLGGGVGVEVDAARAARAAPDVRVTIADFAREFSAWEGDWDLVLFMPGRLVELDGGDRGPLREALMSRAKRIICYAYGDWIGRYGSIDALMAEAWPDVPLARVDVEAGPGVEAILYERRDRQR